MAIRVKIDRARVLALTQPGGVVDQSVAKAAGRVRDRARTIIYGEGRVRTGALGQSIFVEKSPRSRPTHSIYRVGSNLRYAKAQHDGVSGPIRPRHAKALRFKPKGGGSFVFAASTKGFTGIKYLTRALDRTQERDYY